MKEPKYLSRGIECEWCKKALATTEVVDFLSKKVIMRGCPNCIKIKLSKRPECLIKKAEKVIFPLEFDAVMLLAAKAKEEK